MGVRGAGDRLDGMSRSDGAGLALASRLLLACGIAVLLFARGSAEPARTASVEAGAAIEARLHAPAGPLQDGLALGLTTGSAPGCVEQPGQALPTLGCRLRVGERFLLPLTAWAFIEESGEELALELSGEGLPDGASLQRLVAGLPQPGPVTGTGRVDARLEFEPEMEHVTPSDMPLEVELVVRPDGREEEARIALRLLILDGPPATLVSGFAYRDVDGDGIWDAGESGLSGRAVRLEGPAPAAAVTASDGRFGFLVDDPGSYLLRILPEAGWTATSPTEVNLEIGEDGGAAPLVLFGQRPSQQQPSVTAEVRIDRGCLELGDEASYSLDETGQVSLRASGAPELDVRLTLHLPGGGTRQLVSRQRVTGGRWYGLNGRTGLPTGTRRLHLEVFQPGDASGQPAAVADCSYSVGAVSGPSLQVEPEQLTFPETEPGQQSLLPLALHNGGSAILEIDSIGTQGGAASPFVVEAQDAAGFSLPPGGSRGITLRFAPQWEGSFQDSLLIQSNDPARAVLGVPLEGHTPDSTGLRARLVTDRGCEETGQSPVYFDGDPIRITYGASGPAGNAQARLEDILPGGGVRGLVQGTIPVGQDRVYESVVRPPIGRETLRLTVEAGGFSSQARCSFQVAGGAARIVGWKFADLDGDGVWDGKPEPGQNPLPGAEPPVPGWTMFLAGPESGSTTTDQDGRFEFIVSQPGGYRVSEVQGAGWQPRTPTSVDLTVWGTPGEVLPEIRFGNQPVAGGPTPTGGPTTATPGATPGDPTASPTSGPSPTASPSAPPTATADPAADCLRRGDWQRLPLGATVSSQSTPACLQVYLPSRHGGSLQLAAGAGRIWLYGPEVDPAGDPPLVSPARELVYEQPRDAQGWYRLVLRDTPAPGYSVQARFVQQGSADVVPWNFWYFPYSPYAPGPKLYDQPGALSKFDSRFGLSPGAWRYEVDHHRSQQAEGWWGHCWGACVASILLHQPQASGGFSQDELEGLAADFFDGFGGMALEWAWPFVKPAPGYGDQADLYADNFHQRLREYLRDRRVPLHMDLRQETGAGNPQVWNHAVYRYESEMVEDPDALGDPWTDMGRQILVRTTLVANEDFFGAQGSSGTPENDQRRVQEAVYSLVYSSQGEIVPDAREPRPQNWQSMTLRSSVRAGTSLYIPSTITDVRVIADYWTRASSPTGRNPFIDSQRLDALGLRMRY